MPTPRADSFRSVAHCAAATAWDVADPSHAQLSEWGLRARLQQLPLPSPLMHVNTHRCIYICTYIYMYIYIYRDPGAAGPPPPPSNGLPLFRVAVVVVTVSSPPCGVAGVVVMLSCPPGGVAVVVVTVSSTPCGVAVVVVMVSIHPVVWSWLTVVSSTPCGVAVALVRAVVMVTRLHCHVQDFGCQTYFNIIQGLRFRDQGEGMQKMRVFDALISATCPHLLTR